MIVIEGPWVLVSLALLWLSACAAAGSVAAIVAAAWTATGARK